LEAGRFTSQNRGAELAFKKNKKIIDELAAMLNVTQTSADASRYYLVR